MYTYMYLSTTVLGVNIGFLLFRTQVMSNDRVVVCNFETAAQTDPTTCLLMVSRIVVAPSNQKGLAPEVISAYNRYVQNL